MHKGWEPQANGTNAIIMPNTGDWKQNAKEEINMEQINVQYWFGKTMMMMMMMMMMMLLIMMTMMVRLSSHLYMFQTSGTNLLA